jgi:hypothetical protein|nr:hypothetical protein [Candidatus Krumholzibacteria bacterium]
MRFALCGLIFLSLFASPAFAQTSIGFEDPGDLGPLLDYRLPTWSYRTWDADFSLNGGGYDARIAGEKSIYNNFNTGLGSEFMHYRQSEICTRTLRAQVDGDYARSHSGQSDNESSRHTLTGRYNFALDAKRYLGTRPFGVIVGLDQGLSYDEQIASSRYESNTEETERYSRRNSHGFKVGAVWGRARNVVPLIRAQRLSERLAAMGYRRLTAAETQQVAEVFAAEFGYRRVFDRYSRHFWEDVLEPLLGEKLDPYEIFYLADVLNEDVGTRDQGTEVTATWQYSGTNQFRTSATEEDHRRNRDAVLIARWFRNLSLNHQVTASCGARYSFYNANYQGEEYASLQAALSHLWNVADRHIWTNSLSYDGDSRIHGEAREKVVRLSSSWTMSIEDQLSLRTDLGTTYSWYRTQSDDPVPADNIRTGWNWYFGVGVVYHLDRSFL